MTVKINDIPIDEIVEARNALADELITLKLAIDQPSLITRLHKKRILAKITKIENYLSTLDAWLKGIKK